MMAYACRHLGVTRFVAKILEHNEPSLALFKKLGFAEVKRVPVFKEVHLEAAVDDQSREALEKKMGAATVGRYCGGTEGEE